MTDDDPEGSKLLTIPEVCHILGIDRSTWSRRKRAGESLPPVVRIGIIQRIRKEALEAWLIENENGK